MGIKSDKTITKSFCLEHGPTLPSLAIIKVYKS